LYSMQSSLVSSPLCHPPPKIGYRLWPLSLRITKCLCTRRPIQLLLR
jgi:hypothetical protein